MRRYGLTHSKLSAWRGQARGAHAKAESSVRPSYVPAVVEAPAQLSEREHCDRAMRPARNQGDAQGIIEVEIDGVTVSVCHGAESRTIAAVIRALMAGS